MTDEYKGTTVKEIKTADVSMAGTKSMLKKHNKKAGIVIFYFTWCGFCKSIRNDIVKLSKKVPVYAVRIDDPAAKDIAAAYSVESAPNLRFVNSNGEIKPTPYYGDRTVAALTKYVKEKSQTGGCGACSMAGGKKPAKKVVKKTKKVVKKTKKVVKKVVKKTKKAAKKVIKRKK
jgi:thiol-disulfide isomerase/thioredoxin